MKKIDVVITGYNVTAILGWIGIVFGLAAAWSQYCEPTPHGIYFLAVGLLGGGIAVTCSGPIKTVIRREMTLRDIDLPPDQK